MGLFSSSGSSSQEVREPLPAWPTPLGVFGNYCLHEHEVVLKLREKKLSLTGDNFEITMANGQPFLKAKPTAMSLHARNTLLDPTSGQPVLNIQQKSLSLHREFRIFPGESADEQLVTVRGKLKLMGHPEMTAVFKNKSDGRDVQLDVVGDFWGRNASISSEGRTVAKVERNFLNKGELLTDTQTYYLRIAPRVDSAMMAAICICIDERAESYNK